MSSAVSQVLKEARQIWGDLITEGYLKRYLDDGAITKKEAEEILSDGDLK